MQCAAIAHGGPDGSSTSLVADRDLPKKMPRRRETGTPIVLAVGNRELEAKLASLLDRAGYRWNLARHQYLGNSLRGCSDYLLIVDREVAVCREEEAGPSTYLHLRPGQLAEVTVCVVNGRLAYGLSPDIDERVWLEVLAKTAGVASPPAAVRRAA